MVVISSKQALLIIRLRVAIKTPFYRFITNHPPLFTELLLIFQKAFPISLKWLKGEKRFGLIHPAKDNQLHFDVWVLPSNSPTARAHYDQTKWDEFWEYCTPSVYQY